MKKTIKLKKNYEFNYIFKNGKYFAGKIIECFYKKSNKEDYNLLGIAISSKLCNAVKRNKIKRTITAVYNNLEKNIKPGNSFVFLWKKNVQTEKCSFDNIYNDMIYILKEIGIFDENDFNKDY